jgi:eukaryotic-like serine/threonine-protein kinase
VQWQEVRDVFVAAMEVSEGDREEFVSRETSDRPEVEREVKRLLGLHRAAGPFLETATAQADPEDPYLLTPGELVADRFVIVRPLGRGGMGEVYEARDIVLGEHIALKVMRSTSRNSAARTEQFRQEVLLARRIAHPGVCRVYDVASHRGRDGQPLLVLTMELLSGDTLAERLRRGAMPPDDARAIASAIATALDAAHAHGIVHGDIKPENVVLVPRPGEAPRVVLTDFGLATALSDVGHPSHRTGLMGTPAYMAPELFRGEPPSIASDVYAFALLTYRLLSPHDHYWPITRALRIGEGGEAELPSKVDELDPKRRAVLLEALSPTPGDRFKGASAFTHALFPPTRATDSRRALLIGIAAMAATLVLVAVALFSGPLRLTSSDQTTNGAPAMLLLPTTENRTGESELDGMTELLRGQLAQSVRLDVLGPDVVAPVLKQMTQDPGVPPDLSKLREVALRQSASLVLFSAVQLAGGGYQLDVRLERLGTRPSIVESESKQTFEAANRPQLFDTVRRAAIWVRTNVGESRRELADQDRLPTEITTGSWDALRLFARAQQSHEHGDLPTTVVFLQEAVRLDPEFVSAYAQLGDILVSLRREREGYDAWRKAIELANRRQLTTRETLRLRGQFLEETGTLSEAEEAFRAYVLHYPADANANIYLGSLIASQGRTTESIPWLQNAARLRPSSPSALMFLATRLIELRQLDEAAALVVRLRQSTQPDVATWLDALLAFANGDLGAALRRLEELRVATDPGWRSRFHTLRGSWLAEAGRVDEAKQQLLEGIAFDLEQGLRDNAALKWLHVAELLRRAGDQGGSTDAARKAIAVSSDARTLAIAGSVFAQLGLVQEVEQALNALGQNTDLRRVRVARMQLTGELHAVRGRPDLALEAMTDAVRAMRFVESREAYVRALVAGDRRDEAIAVLADWVQHPARFYAGPDPSSAGPWTAAVEDYLALLAQQRKNSEAALLHERLLAFRRTYTER